MSEPAIELRNVGKMYRLYRRPLHRAIDAFGLGRLLPGWKRRYNEFWALRGVTERIRRGQRLGIVGSNGAGKSTLLKMVAGTLAPTEGVVDVNGEVQALMELGTGFHPEFTGRENIRASLAYQGFSARNVARKMDEIVDFAELGDFIDQPLKTYSAGMNARLGFSTATSIEPDILIIDEVLGAGDAYFAGKCLDRMKRLSSGGATVLFVSHDMSSVEQLCDDAIWLDRGQMVMGAETSTVSRAYADFVRKREEKRLKAKNQLMQLTPSAPDRSRFDNPLQIICRLGAPTGAIEVSKAALDLNGQTFAGVDVGAPQDATVGEQAFVFMDGLSGQWGPPRSGHDDEPFRPVAIEGAGGAGVVFNVDGFAPGDDLTVTWRLRGASAAVDAFDGTAYCSVGRVEGGAEWGEHRLRLPGDLLTSLLRQRRLIPEANGAATGDARADGGDGAGSDDYEILAGSILFESVRLCDAAEQDRVVFETFEELQIRMRYRTTADIPEPEFAATFHRSGIIALQCLSQFSDALPGVLPAGSEGEVVLCVPSLPLGRGRYLITLGVFPRIDMKSGDTERTAFLLQDRRYEIQVEQPEGGRIDLGMARARVLWQHRQGTD